MLGVPSSIPGRIITFASRGWGIGVGVVALEFY